MRIVVRGAVRFGFLARYFETRVARLRRRYTQAVTFAPAGFPRTTKAPRPRARPIAEADCR
jgi:hypothetical protein